MTDDELIAKAEKELASLTRCMSPDKVAKLEAHRLIALARIGASVMPKPAAPASPMGEDVVEKVVRAFKAVLLDIDFLIERGHLTDIRNDMIYTEARAALAAIGRK